MTTAYSELKDTLKTGDVVLFSGRYHTSKIVEKLENSMWSHCGLVMRLEGCDEPILYEATALVNLEDKMHHDHITGPKIVDLYERLKTYGQDVVPYEPPVYAVRRLSTILGPDSVETMKAILTELHGLPNPDQNRMIWEVVLGRFFHIPTKMIDITCSGLVAYTYEKLGLLKGNKPINGYMPKDFSTDGRLALTGCTLSDEIVIDLMR